MQRELGALTKSGKTPYGEVFLQLTNLLFGTYTSLKFLPLFFFLYPGARDTMLGIYGATSKGGEGQEEWCREAED
jgi:hypothetical protein